VVPDRGRARLLALGRSVRPSPARNATAHEFSSPSLRSRGARANRATGRPAARPRRTTVLLEVLLTAPGDFRVVASSHGKSLVPAGWQDDERRLTAGGYVEPAMTFCRALRLDRPVALRCSIGGKLVLRPALIRRPPRPGGGSCQVSARADPGWWRAASRTSQRSAATPGAERRSRHRAARASAAARSRPSPRSRACRTPLCHETGAGDPPRGLEQARHEPARPPEARHRKKLDPRSCGRGLPGSSARASSSTCQPSSSSRARSQAWVNRHPCCQPFAGCTK
jgi:hypothetical protein